MSNTKYIIEEYTYELVLLKIGIREYKMVWSAKSAL